jgi:phosphatidylserine/phosphatidylglycerophosphate/cardiolipin synthase-like enzyme
VKRVFVLVASLAVMTLTSVPSDASTGSVSAGGAAVSGAKAEPKQKAETKPKPKPKWMPPEGAWFNTPRHGAKQWVLHSHIVAAINHAKKGSFIRIALFSFDRTFVAGRLIAAKRRGVHVQVLLNDHQVTPAQRMLHRALGTKRFHHKSFAYECHHGCRSGGENLHTKFYLFSHTGGTVDTVMTGSVNLTGNSAMNQYNDMFVINDAQKLTKGFMALWAQMRLDRPAHPSWFVRHISKSFTLEATPYPHAGPRHDPIISILDKVKCHGATGPTGNRAHHTIVRVVMHAWNDPRGVYLAKKVRSLFAQGCDVRLMYGFAGRTVRNAFATRSKRGFIPIHTTGKDTNDDGFIDLYTHQKELLISGHYGKSTHTRLVVTGSSNYNLGGIRGDEEILLIRNRAAAWRDYINDFTRMYAHFSTLVKYIPYPHAAASPTTTARAFSFGRALTEPQIAPRLTIAPGPRPGGPAWESD